MQPMRNTTEPGNAATPACPDTHKPAVELLMATHVARAFNVHAQRERCSALTQGWALALA